MRQTKPDENEDAETWIVQCDRCGPSRGMDPAPKQVAEYLAGLHTKHIHVTDAVGASAVPADSVELPDPERTQQTESGETSVQALIRELIQRGIGAQDIANEIGVSRQSVENWAAGDVEPVASNRNRLRSLRDALVQEAAPSE